jgi:predicted transposase YdaD
VNGYEIVNVIKDRMLSMEKLPAESKTITSIEDIAEVLSMYETRTKRWEASVLERGVEKGKLIGHEEGIEKRDLEIVEKMILNNMSNAEIRKITGMSISKIEQIRRKRKAK